MVESYQFVDGWRWRFGEPRESRLASFFKCIVQGGLNRLTEPAEARLRSQVFYGAFHHSLIQKRWKSHRAILVDQNCNKVKCGACFRQDAPVLSVGRPRRVAEKNRQPRRAGITWAGISRLPDERQCTDRSVEELESSFSAAPQSIFTTNVFKYSDPAGRRFLGIDAAADVFRSQIDGLYQSFARRPDSGFTWIEAFDQLSAGPPSQPSVDWLAFPVTAQVTDREIDRDRFIHQDEYVEWRAEKKQNKLAAVTFTTEFPEYLEAFAAVGLDALVLAIQDIIPGANPTADDLFGPGFNPNSTTPAGRSHAFRSRLVLNAWNNGQKGILCLRAPFNTLGALFNLLTECGVARTHGTPENTCSIVAPTGACGPDRQSDPAICTAAQRIARDKMGFSLGDPAGVRILKLEGDWKIKKTVINVNDETQNQGVWIVSRNRRRGVLSVVQGLTVDGEALVSGAQVSKKLRVAVDLLAAPESSLPK